MMERLEYDRYGGPEVLHLSAFTLPEPQPMDVVVRVAAPSIAVAKTISLTDAPAVIAALEQRMRLDGKAVIAF
jgi:NADPH:quinone reductase-like Zn-dependent oxidoreductase